MRGGNQLSAGGAQGAIEQGQGGQSGAADPAVEAKLRELRGGN